jgi:hypothetical protein
MIWDNVANPMIHHPEYIEVYYWVCPYLGLCIPGLLMGLFMIGFTTLMKGYSITFNWNYPNFDPSSIFGTKVRLGGPLMCCQQFFKM